MNSNLGKATYKPSYKEKMNGDVGNSKVTDELTGKSDISKPVNSGNGKATVNSNPVDNGEGWTVVNRKHHRLKANAGETSNAVNDPVIIPASSSAEAVKENMGTSEPAALPVANDNNGESGNLSGDLEGRLAGDTGRECSTVLEPKDMQIGAGRQDDFSGCSRPVSGADKFPMEIRREIHFEFSNGPPALADAGSILKEILGFPPRSDPPLVPLQEIVGENREFSANLGDATLVISSGSPSTSLTSASLASHPERTQDTNAYVMDCDHLVEDEDLIFPPEFTPSKENVCILRNLMKDQCSTIPSHLQEEYINLVNQAEDGEILDFFQDHLGEKNVRDTNYTTFRNLRRSTRIRRSPAKLSEPTRSSGLKKGILK